jgi:transposase-like protein
MTGQNALLHKTWALIEMTEHLHLTEVGRIEQLKVPRDRVGTFLTEVFERYMPNDRSADMAGRFEEAVLEMYLQGISTWKIERVTGKLSGLQISKDAVSRIAGRLDEELDAWRSYPYLYLDATFLKAIWAGVAEDVALLTAVGVDEKGYREVLAVQAAPGERTEVWRDLLKDLLERKLRGVRLVISDDADAIKFAVSIELPQAKWQRCTVHFERNILAKVPKKMTKVVAPDLKTVFQAARRETAEVMVQGFTDRYRATYQKAARCLEAGLADALTYTEFPSSHHRYIRTTNGLERLFSSASLREPSVSRGEASNEGGWRLSESAERREPVVGGDAARLRRVYRASLPKTWSRYTNFSTNPHNSLLDPGNRLGAKKRAPILRLNNVFSTSPRSLML